MSNLRPAALGWFVVALAYLMWAQLPSPKTLSAEDEREFRKELERLQSLLATANDRPAVQLQIANTYAAGGQYSEAMQLLRRLVDGDFGFDPSRDPDFADLRNTREFRSILEEVHRQTPPVSQSHPITTINERDLFPESFAFDSTRNSFFLGSTAKGNIVRCSAGKPCVPFVTPSDQEKAYVLGLKIDKGSATLWAATNKQGGASLRGYDINTGKLKRIAQVEGKHVFNDLAISSTGIVYVTDTSEASVYQMRSQDNTLKRMAPDHIFTSANGIAISSDDKLLYVSVWGDGVDIIDLRAGSVEPLRHPDNICLAFIDGLYFVDGSLIAIQNGTMLPRIVQLKLDESGRRIKKMTILERRNPSFDGITTGVVAGKALYYIANPQIDKKNGARADPLNILAVQVVH